MKLKDIIVSTEAKLMDDMTTLLRKCGYIPSVSKDYVFAKGVAPVLVVAHVDTVHRTLVSYDLIASTSSGNVLMSPVGIGGDDRCGVYIISQLLESGLRPSVLLTNGEEKGGIGAKAFCREVKAKKLKGIKFMVEYDRKGDKDCVFYDGYNKDFHAYIEKYGYKTAIGSYSDIVDLMDEYDIAGVNLSCGYYNAHTEGEFIVVSQVARAIAVGKKIIADSACLKSPFTADVCVTASYSAYSNWSATPRWYAGSSTAFCDNCLSKTELIDINSGIDGEFCLCEKCIDEDESVQMCAVCGGLFTVNHIADVAFNETGETVHVCESCFEYEAMYCDSCKCLITVHPNDWSGMVLCDGCMMSLDEPMEEKITINGGIMI